MGGHPTVGEPFGGREKGLTLVIVVGEIDLSIGFVSGIGGIVAAEIVKYPRNWPWWVAILLALLVTAAIGALRSARVAARAAVAMVW